MAEVDAGAPAPVETPAAPAAPAPEPTAGQEGDPSQAEQQPESKPPKVLTQDEVDRLIAKEKARTERRVERAIRAEVRAEMLERELQARSAPKEAPKAQGEPDPKDYGDNWQAYVNAVVEHRMAKAIEAREAEAQRRSMEERTQRETVEQREHIRRNVVEKGVEKYDDFQERAMAEDLPITRPMAAAIAESDIGADVWYWLGCNPKEAARIADLPPTKQVRELGKIEEKLLASPKPSQAPPPIKPSSGNASPDKDPDKMSADEWRQWREAQLRKKRS